MSLRRSEATEAISSALGKMEIAAHPFVAPHEQRQCTEGKSPCVPLFQRGKRRCTLLWKRRAGEDFTETVSSIHNPVPKQGPWLAMTTQSHKEGRGGSSFCCPPLPRSSSRPPRGRKKDRRRTDRECRYERSKSNISRHTMLKCAIHVPSDNARAGKSP